MSDLNRKLQDLMPKVAGMSPWYKEQITPRFEVDHIGAVADAFARAIDGDLPKDARELRDTVYVFGQILAGEMQRRMNHMQRQCDDLLNATPIARILVQRKATDGAP